MHTIRTCTSMFILYELVEVLLGQVFTAHEAYLISYPILRDLGLFKVRLSLLEYLQIASTHPTAGNPHPPTFQDQLGRADYPVCPAVLNQHCTSVLYRLLPALRPSDMGILPESFDEGLSEGVANITPEMHADCRSHETRASEASRRKTFRERYGDRIADEILLFTSSVDGNFLPSFYKSWEERAK
jgi:hypothetical protein